MLAPDAASTPAEPRRTGRPAALAQGLRDALPFAPSVAVLGTVWGTAAAPARLTPPTAVLMSTLVFSGSAQFAALPLWRDAAGVLVLSTLVLSLRFALMTASVAPALARLPRPLRALLAFGMTDETYALTMVQRRGRFDPAYLLGGWLALYLAWLGGTVVGVLVGARVPEAWLGPLESLFPVVFLALAVLCCVSRATTVVMLLGAALAAAGAAFAPGGWHVVLAGLLASLAGPLLERWLGDPPPNDLADNAP